MSRYHDRVSRYRYIHSTISVYLDIRPDIEPDFENTISGISRYRVIPDIGYFPISGMTRYREIPDIGRYPVSGPIKKCPDIGTNIRIHGYRDLGHMSRYRDMSKNPNVLIGKSQIYR